MKKIFNKIFFISLSVIFILILISCDKTNLVDEINKEQIEHIHTFNDKYLYNDISHWKECSCGVKSEEISHTFGLDEEVQKASAEASTQVKRICQVCQYETILNLPQENHQHTYSNTWSYDDNAHYHKATCEHTEEKINQEVHIYGNWIIVTEAQENVPGLKKRECSVCNHSIIKEIPAKLHQHTYSNTWSYDDDTHYHKADCEHIEEKINQEAHTYGNWIVVTEAQENLPGLKKRECSVCKYEQTQVIDKLNHQHVYSEVWFVDIEPTCSAAGSKSRHCLTCDEKIEITEIPLLEHSYNAWEVEITPTILSAGSLTRVCQNNSNHKEHFVLPSLNQIDYTYETIVNPTCGEKGLVKYTINKDGQEIQILDEIESLGHQIESNWNSNENCHWLTCENCKEIISSAEHSYDANYNCVVCGYIHNLGTPGLYYILTGDGSSYSVSDYFGIDTRIEIPEMYNNLPVTKIGENLFSHKEIVEVNLPSSIKKIGDSAFDQCYKLSKINLPDGLLEIGNSAFSNCFNLKEITIPESVLSIGESAFSSCYKLTNLIIPDSVLGIGDYAFANCQGLTNVVLSKNVTSLGKMAFQSCFDLIRIEIPKTVKVIQNHTFAHCKSLESVFLAEGVEVISNYAFGECSNLREIVLPKSLTQIQNGAFDCCEKLEELYFTGTLEEWSNLIKNGFQNNNCSPVIYFYAASKPSVVGKYWYYQTDGTITKW